MPHMLYTAEQVARSTLAALRNRSTLARTVNQDFSADFIPGKGAAVTVKSPVHLEPARVFTAADRAADNSITYSNLYEPYRTLKLTDQIYQAVRLPDDFVTFKIQDMEQQVVGPMAITVADKLNNIVASAMEAVPAGLTAQDKGKKDKLFSTDGNAYDNTEALLTAGKTFNGMGLDLGNRFKATSFTANDHAGVLPAIRQARSLLVSRGVPVTDRYLAVGTGWSGALLSMPNLLKVNESGDSSLLREATLGRLYGFTVIEDATIDPYSAYAYHMDAITLATRVKNPPQGAAFSAVISQDGFSLRYLHDYNVDKLEDRAVVDLFANAETLDLQRVVKLTGKAGIEEPSTAAAPAVTPGT